jgi:steroid 5-alpha reductase family enzyme
VFLTDLIVTAAVAAVVLSAVMAGAWWIQRQTGNTGWIDVVWTFSLGGTAAVAALVPLMDGAWPQLRQLPVAALVVLWSLRLGWHILLRTQSVGDDPRYRNLIAQWGKSAGREMFFHLQIQAAVSLLLALSITLAARNPNPGLRLQDVFGPLILLTGIMGEAIADRQLRQFKRLGANRGAICDVGLWSRSRHPNYFFEWLCWCAYPVIAIDFGGYNPYGWLTLLAPLCMYWLLTSVSGIPPLEQHMERTRGDAYRAYQKRTNAFFPSPKAALTPQSPRVAAKELRRQMAKLSAAAKLTHRRYGRSSKAAKT